MTAILQSQPQVPQRKPSCMLVVILSFLSLSVACENWIPSCKHSIVILQLFLNVQDTCDKVCKVISCTQLFCIWCVSVLVLLRVLCILNAFEL